MKSWNGLVRRYTVRSLVEKVRAHTQTAVADIVLGRPEEDCFKDKNLINFVKRIFCGNKMSFRFTSEVENAVMDAALSEEIIGRMDVEVFWLDWLMKPVAVFEEDQINPHVYVKLAIDTFLHRRDRLPTEEGESLRSQNSTFCEKKNETGPTGDSPDVYEISRDFPAQQIRVGKKQH